MQRLAYLVFFIVFFVSVSCKESTLSNEKAMTDSSCIRIDTSHQYLYDFMQVVIKDQKLRYDYGLILTPETSITNEESDQSLLKNFLIEKKETVRLHTKRKPIPLDTSFTDSTQVISDSSLRICTDYKSNLPLPIFVNGNEFQKCLSTEDIDYMLSEKERWKDFNWDNQRLGFNLANEKNWYVFSLPYFTKDKKKAVLLIRDLCKPFLCGGGYILLYTKEESKWKSNEIKRWIH